MRAIVPALALLGCAPEPARPPPTILSPAPPAARSDSTAPPARAHESTTPLCDENEPPSTCPVGFERTTEWVETPPCLRIGFPSVGEHTNLAEIRGRALNRADAYFACYDRSARAGTTTNGMITYRLRALPNGSAENVEILQNELGQDVADCMKEITASIKWPETELGLSAVVLTFLIRTRKYVEDPNTSCQPSE